MFAAHLGIRNGKNEWEQLWGQEVGTQRFIICCIPFFIYDVDLGDEVETDADFVLRKVLQKSGQVTFRVWFGEMARIARENAVKEIEALQVSMEWSSENLLALSVAEAGAQHVADRLHLAASRGLLTYENGRTRHD